MRRAVNWAPAALTVAASVLLLGAEPAAPRPLPPLPVPPIRHEAMPPYYARITISGDIRKSGVFEECVDPAARSAQARAMAKARPPGAASPLTGCTRSHEMRPGGAFHSEVRCDRANGAKSSFRMVSDGTLDDLRMHVEMYNIDPATKAPRTTAYDSRLVRLGPCPADLKPGQKRRPGGPILAKDEAERLLDDARGAAQ